MFLRADAADELGSAVSRGAFGLRWLTVATLVFSACAHRTVAELDAAEAKQHQHRFDNAEEWAVQFEDPKRDGWQMPDRVIASLALRPTDVVADIGSATGYFAVRFARAVPQGRVYGVDIETSMVEYLTRRADAESLTNLVALLGAPDDPKLPTPVDVLTVVNTYHHLSDRPAYFRRLAASLKPGGRVVIIDFRISSTMGPPAKAKVPPEVVNQELAEAGYTRTGSYDFLPEQDFHVFARAGSQ